MIDSLGNTLCIGHQVIVPESSNAFTFTAIVSGINEVLDPETMQRIEVDPSTLIRIGD